MVGSSSRCDGSRRRLQRSAILAEIYYMLFVRTNAAYQPRDTLVDRWSDAAVGIVLLVLLRVMGVGTTVIAILTVTLSGVVGRSALLPNRIRPCL